MANKRKSAEKHEQICKWGKKAIDAMVETENLVKEQRNKTSSMNCEKQGVRSEVVLKDKGMDIINKANIKNSNMELLMSPKDEGPSNLSWLVNLSAASLFTDTHPKQPDETANYYRTGININFMANKRKSAEKHEQICKRGKKAIDAMVETENLVKEQRNKTSSMNCEKQGVRSEVVLKDKGMDIINKANIKNSNMELLMSPKDEGPSNLSWLVNLSAASLFTDTHPKQPDETANCPLITSEEAAAYTASMKPGLTYTELIEKALKEHGELTVSEIYKWIYSNYPYYKKNDGRWKNSIRHNLSINPQFRKGMKCNHGGHFWTLNKEYDEQFKKWQENKKTVRGEKKKKQMAKAEEDEIEIATRSIMLQEENSNDSMCFNHDSDPSLLRAANDILNGVDKQVEVEYMNRIDGVSAPLVIEEDIMECSDPMLADPLLFSDCLELGFQPYELIDPRL